MKKNVIFVSIAILLVLLLCSPYLIDNTAANLFKSEIEEKIESTENVTLIKAKVGLGNVGGTGNHTDMCVFALIKSELSEQQLSDLFDNEIGIKKADNSSFNTDAMKALGISFEDVTFEEGEEYYVVEFIKQAPCSDFDLRGH